MAAKKRIYRLTTRYEIRAFEVEEGAPGSGLTYDRWTDERLTIEDTVDLTNASTLSHVLQTIDRIHEVIRDEIS